MTKRAFDVVAAGLALVLLTPLFLAIALQMRNRVDHDLYYIDNWSVAFDLYIVLLTVISSKAQQNAY